MSITYFSGNGWIFFAKGVAVALVLAPFEVVMEELDFSPVAASSTSIGDGEDKALLLPDETEPLLSLVTDRDPDTSDTS